MRKKEKGITLIALVITIIVLLILAGVALSMVAGNEGILTKAEKAVSETNVAGAKEQVELMIVELSADYYEKKFVDKTVSGSLVDYIKDKLSAAKPTSNGEFSVSIDGSGNVSVTDKDGNSVVSGSLDENGKIIWGESAGGSGGTVGEPPLEAPENPVASYDVSAAGDGSVMAYVTQREGETERYDLLIIGEGPMVDLVVNDVPAYNNYIEQIISVEISKGVTNIGDAAFFDCTNLSSVTVGESVTSIGDNAFYYCTSLSSVNIPEGVTSIGREAFMDCTNLSSINIPESVTSIGDYAFNSCTSLSSINIPEGVTSIEFATFSGCTSLSSINIPASVTSIGSYAFSDCTSLSSINIPASVTSIGIYVLTGCTSLSTITVEEGNTVLDSRDNSNAIILTETNALIEGCKNTNIPESVTSIGHSAFSGCTTLSSINIPESVTSIGAFAFDGCTSLSSINIPANVTSIEERVFYYCTSLSSINIPDSVTSIGRNALDGTAWYNAQPEGVVYAGKVLYEYKGTMPSNTTITVNEGTKGIADEAFYGCTNLSSINIPNSVTSIGRYAFRDCTSLSSINIPESVTSIGYYVFWGWTEEQTINCEILKANKPSGWDAKWDYEKNSTRIKAKINWGVSM